MSAAKLLIDGIRRDCPSRLTLAKYRDVISRLVFGAPYSATIAAESAGKLGRPDVDQVRAGNLESEHGQWIRQLALIAHQHVRSAAPLAHLTLRDVYDIIAIAKERDRSRRPIETLDDLMNAKPGTPAAANIELTQNLRSRMAELSSPALIELVALTWLGRGDHDDFSSLLNFAQQQFGRHDVGYLAAKGPLHTYLQAGLLRLDSRP